MLRYARQGCARSLGGMLWESSYWFLPWQGGQLAATGDQAKMTKRGFFYMLGMLKGLICGGENPSPAVIEHCWGKEGQWYSIFDSFCLWVHCLPLQQMQVAEVLTTWRGRCLLPCWMRQCTRHRQSKNCNSLSPQSWKRGAFPQGTLETFPMTTSVQVRKEYLQRIFSSIEPRKLIASVCHFPMTEGR